MIKVTNLNEVEFRGVESKPKKNKDGAYHLINVDDQGGNRLVLYCGDSLPDGVDQLKRGDLISVEMNITQNWGKTNLLLTKVEKV